MLLPLGGAVTEPASIPAPSSRPHLDARFTALRPRLLAVARGLVGTEAADDVVQEAYLNATRAISQLRDQKAIEAWLTRIIISVAYNHHRRLRAWRERLPLLAADASKQPGQDAGLRELVELLPARERTVLVLHYGYGYALDEIAALVGISHTNARTIIHRARRRLATAWELSER